MATTVAVTGLSKQPVEITDSTLVTFQEMRKSVFDETTENINTFVPKWEDEEKGVKAFEFLVRTEGSKLQHKQVLVPTKQELEEQREAQLNAYWNFMATCERISVFAGAVQKSIEFVAPQPRLYVDEKRLEQDQPEFLNQLKSADDVCRGYVEKLSKSHVQLVSLHQRMVTNLKGEVAWSLQRFCQIVDNEGKPISFWTRALDNVTAPVIPKPKPKPSSIESKDLKQADNANNVNQSPVLTTTPVSSQNDVITTVKLTSMEGTEASIAVNTTDEVLNQSKEEDKIPTVERKEQQSNSKLQIEDPKKVDNSNQVQNSRKQQKKETKN